jgi:hypothetical protein
MEKHYVVFVEFARSISTNAPTTQTIDVRSGGAEFGAMLHALDASPDIVSINVWHKSHTTSKMTKMTNSDLGLDINKIK